MTPVKVISGACLVKKDDFDTIGDSAKIISCIQKMLTFVSDFISLVKPISIQTDVQWFIMVVGVQNSIPVSAFSTKMMLESKRSILGKSWTFLRISILYCNNVSLFGKADINNISFPAILGRGFTRLKICIENGQFHIMVMFQSSEW